MENHMKKKLDQERKYGWKDFFFKETISASNLLILMKHMASQFWDWVRLEMTKNRPLWKALDSFIRAFRKYIKQVKTSQIKVIFYLTEYIQILSFWHVTQATFQASRNH